MFMRLVLGSVRAPIESLTPTSQLEATSLISETAAVSGISTNFSTGDRADFREFGIRATVQPPADSPFATAVGGITLALNTDNAIAWQAGWGTNETLLAIQGTIFDPPLVIIHLQD
jgi:subtilase family serine protease